MERILIALTLLAQLCARLVTESSSLLQPLSLLVVIRVPLLLETNALNLILLFVSLAGFLASLKLGVELFANAVARRQELQKWLRWAGSYMPLALDQSVMLMQCKLRKTYSTLQQQMVDGLALIVLAHAMLLQFLIAVEVVPRENVHVQLALYLLIFLLLSHSSAQLLVRALRNASAVTSTYRLVDKAIANLKKLKSYSFPSTAFSSTSTILDFDCLKGEESEVFEYLAKLLDVRVYWKECAHPSFLCQFHPEVSYVLQFCRIYFYITSH